METVKSIKAKIRSALKRQNTYSRDLEICIGMVAGSYYAFLLAQNDIEDLTSSFVEEMSRENNIKLVPHPAFKTLKDSQESVRKGLRELGLTLSTLSVSDDDELSDLIEDVESVK